MRLIEPVMLNWSVILMMTTKTAENADIVTSEILFKKIEKRSLDLFQALSVHAGRILYLNYENREEKRQSFTTFEDVSKRADDMMYTNKKIMKAKRVD